MFYRHVVLWQLYTNIGLWRFELLVLIPVVDFIVEFVDDRIKFNIGIDYASDQQIGFHLKDDRLKLQSMNRTVADSIYRYFTFLQNVSTSNLRINSSS
jgi:hypothetical protein